MYAQGGGARKPKVAKRKYTLPASTPRGDAPQTRKQDFAKAARTVQTKQHYRDRAAASQTHPNVLKAERAVQAASTGPQKKRAKEKLAAVREHQLHVSDKLGWQHYVDYLDKTYSQVAGYLGPTEPHAHLGPTPPHTAAYVPRVGGDDVVYSRQNVRDFMRPSTDPSAEHAAAVPLHEWMHTRQWHPSGRAGEEGHAELGRAYLGQRLGLAPVETAGKYSDWMLKAARDDPQMKALRRWFKRTAR